MVDFYTPPNWLSIWGFLDQIALKHFNQKIDYANGFKLIPGSKNSFEHNNTIIHLEDLEIKNLQKVAVFPAKLSLERLNIMISEDLERVKREISEGRRSRPVVNPYNIFRQYPDRNLDYPLKITYQRYSLPSITLNNFSDILFWRAFFETRRLVRDALANETLRAYIYHEDAYKKVPSIIWHAEEHWYHLLAKGRTAAYIPSILYEDQVCGNIFFKKEDADNWVSSTPSDQQDIPIAFENDLETPLSEKPLINLSIYSTAWLMVLNEAYKQYGKEELGQISKECLEDFMKAYITEKNLDIAPSDIPLLAKFIRLPEQKKGRAYQINKKKNH